MSTTTNDSPSFGALRKRYEGMIYTFFWVGFIVLICGMSFTHSKSLEASNAAVIEVIREEKKEAILEIQSIGVSAATEIQASLDKQEVINSHEDPYDCTAIEKLTVKSVDIQHQQCLIAETIRGDYSKGG